MVRKYRNHTPLTNSRHHEEEPQNTTSHKTWMTNQHFFFFLLKIIANLKRTQSNLHNIQGSVNINPHKQWRNIGPLKSDSKSTEPLP